MTGVSRLLPRPRDVRDREWDARDMRDSWQGTADWGRADLRPRRETLYRRDTIDRDREMRERGGRDACVSPRDRQDGRLDTGRMPDQAHRQFSWEGVRCRPKPQGGLCAQVPHLRLLFRGSVSLNCA